MASQVSRLAFLQSGAAASLSGAGAFAALATAARAQTTVPLAMRWYGGGVYELAPPGDNVIVLVDAWIWNNTGYARFNLSKPPELSSAAAYVAHIKSRNPKAVIVALTHDHGDHMGDYFELLKALVDGGVDVKTTGQSDLMRAGLVPQFKAAGLDNTKLVLNNGAGMNFGGTSTYAGVRLRLVPAVHSTTLGFPPAGFIIDVGGTRVYASGDTDLFGDMALIGRRYRPQLAVVSAGGGPYTMNAREAASAVQMIGAPQAIPVHYAHNPAVGGPETGGLFRDAMAQMAPNVKVSVMQPGQRLALQLGAAASD